MVQAVSETAVRKIVQPIEFVVKHTSATDKVRVSRLQHSQHIQPKDFATVETSDFNYFVRWCPRSFSIGKLFATANYVFSANTKVTSWPPLKSVRAIRMSLHGKQHISIVRRVEQTRYTAALSAFRLTKMCKISIRWSLHSSDKIQNIGARTQIFVKLTRSNDDDSRTYPLKNWYR